MNKLTSNIAKAGIALGLFGAGAATGTAVTPGEWHCPTTMREQTDRVPTRALPDGANDGPISNIRCIGADGSFVDVTPGGTPVRGVSADGVEVADPRSLLR